MNGNEYQEISKASALPHFQPMLPEETPCRAEPPKADSYASGQRDLGGIIGKNGFNALRPHLHELSRATNPENPLGEIIRENIDVLQEIFIERVFELFRRKGINTESKVTLRLDKRENLAVLDDGPEKTLVDKTLGGAPELSGIFREIALQSELLRDMNNISRLLNDDLRQGGEYARLPGHLLYQITFKGEMSHFYFARA